MKVLDGSVDIIFDIKKAIGYGNYFITIEIEYKSEKIELFHIARNSTIFDTYNDLKVDGASYNDLQDLIPEYFYVDYIWDDKEQRYRPDIDINFI